MVDRLTTKQEKFVQALVGGATQRAAYKAAYSAGRMSDDSIDQHASRLMAQVKVKARYDELVAEVASRVQWSREKAARELIEVRDIALRHIRQTRRDKANITEKGGRELADLPKAAVTLVISSTAELNKMFGIYDTNDDDGKVTVIIDV